MSPSLTCNRLRHQVRIGYRYRGGEKVFDQPCDAVVLGRPRHGVSVDIDLTPDLRVSRPHARIFVADGQYWVEDLGSANGTEVDGKPIKGIGKVRLEPGQTIRISDTTIEVDIPVADRSWPGDDATMVDTQDRCLDIGETIDAAAPAFGLGPSADPDRAQALALLYELPLRFGEETELDGLFQTVIERLVAIIPAARAMARRQGFIWREDTDPSQSQLLNRIKAGMYVPLMWKGQVLGVACVDNTDSGTLFTADDLR